LAERRERIREVGGEQAFYRALMFSDDPKTIDMVNDLAQKYPGFILADEEILGELREKNRQLRTEKDFALQQQTTAYRDPTSSNGDSRRRPKGNTPIRYGQQAPEMG
jgi:hypothetical protein